MSTSFTRNFDFVVMLILGAILVVVLGGSLEKAVSMERESTRILHLDIHLEVSPVVFPEAATTNLFNKNESS